MEPARDGSVETVHRCGRIRQRQGGIGPRHGSGGLRRRQVREAGPAQADVRPRQRIPAEPEHPPVMLPLPFGGLVRTAAVRRATPSVHKGGGGGGGGVKQYCRDRTTDNRLVPTPASDDAFAEVKAKVDLVKVVQEHVRLTKRNKDFWGLCPFHGEDSPSFKVNPQMQSWYCFGCERSGDVFTFVELIEKTDKRGALQLLAERAGVELKTLTPEQKERSDSRKRLLTMLKLAAQYYEYVLWSNPAGEPGRRLLEARLGSEETARRFQLGSAPPSRGFAHN